MYGGKNLLFIYKFLKILNKPTSLVNKPTSLVNKIIQDLFFSYKQKYKKNIDKWTRKIIFLAPIMSFALFYTEQFI